MDKAHCMAMTLISSNVYSMLSLGTLNVISILSIEGICVAALAHAVMTINEFTFHPLLIALFISDFYFFIFFVIVPFSILSLQYVNSMKRIVRLLLGSVGGGD
jgi:hypothetical protein